MFTGIFLKAQRRPVAADEGDRTKPKNRDRKRPKEHTGACFWLSGETETFLPNHGFTGEKEYSFGDGSIGEGFGAFNS